MNIVLYHIDKISSVDTPYFSNITQQTNYFDSHIIKEVDTSFYPPYYHNEIKFDDSDVDINTGVNYLSLEYNNKRYYYFINGIDYISSGVIKLIIDMDVIQTFMFNINVASGVINRQHIKRWNGTKNINGTTYNVINRNYIRENVSKGNSKLNSIKSFLKMNDVYSSGEIDDTIINDETLYVILFKCAKRLEDTDTNMINTTYGDSSGAMGFVDSSTYYMIPIKNMDRNMSINYYHYDSTNNKYVSDGSADVDKMIKNLVLSTYITNIYVVPLNVFKGDFHLQGHNLYFDTNVVDSTASHDSYTKYLYYVKNNIKYIMLNYVPTKVISHDVSFGFNNNYTRRTWKEEPSLLDNNYIKLTFGDEGVYSTIDLYYSNVDLFEWKYYVSIENFSRIYSIISYSYAIDITGKYLGETYDDWTNSTVSTTPYTLSIINDSWNNWKDNNKFTIPMAYVGSATNVALMGANIKGSRYGNQSQEDIALGVLNGDYGKRETASRLNAYHYNRSLGYQESGSMADKFTNIATNQYNSLLAPNTFKNIGNFITSMLDKSGRLSLKTYIVDDIEYCGMYYRMFGNLVRRPVYNVTNIFSNVQTRESYNYFELINSEIHLLNYIESEDIVYKIKERLSNGIRLWNVMNTPTVVEIGNYNLANKEITGIIPFE